jgi:hypothetical protein
MITLERKIEILTNQSTLPWEYTDDEVDWYHSIIRMGNVDNTRNTLIQLLREQKLNEILK